MNELSVWQLAWQPATVKRALRIALVVGFVLAGINHGPAILAWDISPGRWAQILLTFVVPYAVSTVSSVAARRES